MTYPVRAIKIVISGSVVDSVNNHGIFGLIGFDVKHRIGSNSLIDGHVDYY